MKSHEQRATSHEQRATSHEPRVTSHEPQGLTTMQFFFLQIIVKPFIF